MGMALSLLLFLVASLGVVLNSTNLIMVLMNLELMLMSLIILFCSVSNLYGTGQGHLFSLMMITIAACESAMGLTIMVSYYSITGHISVKQMNLLRG